jgi:DNA primase
MYILQNPSRSTNRSKVSGKAGNIGNGHQDGTDYRGLISRAQSADLQVIFEHYDIEIDEYNKKCLCPFAFHNDKTASFNYVKRDNYFNCFGCHTGGGPVEFVSSIENIEKIEAAKLIINQFSTDEYTSLIVQKDYHETQKLWLNFSIHIREFRKNNIDDLNALTYSDKICMAFDKITSKQEISNDGLKMFINTLMQKLGQYE